MDDEIRKGLLTELMEKYDRKIFNYIYYSLWNYEDARDLTQEVFFKAYKGLPKFRNQSTHYTWLFRIAINTVRSHLRKKNWILSFDGIPEDFHPAHNSVEREHYTLQRALYACPSEFREVILLYYYEEYPLQEIAKILGIPEGTVKSRLHRARSFLKKFLEENGGEDGV